MVEHQKERREALAQAARALRIYREFTAENNAERMRFWDGIFRFWLNEYREQSALVMSDRNEVTQAFERIRGTNLETLNLMKDINEQYEALAAELEKNKRYGIRGIYDAKASAAAQRFDSLLENWTQPNP